VVESVTDLTEYAGEMGIHPTMAPLVPTAICVGEQSLDMGRWCLRFHAGDEVPEWAVLTFMVNPLLWATPYCALKRSAVPGVAFLDRELAYLQPRRLDDGALRFEIVYACLGLAADNARRETLTPTQTKALYAEGWRVD
jgi:hypothetical protein